MRCPFCHSDNDKVLDSRSAQSGYRVRRKRLCQKCGRRFVTMEQIEELNVRVVKGDETREPFDREKIRRGIERACSKRSVPSEQIELTVQKIEAAIYSEFDFEIPAAKIGEVVMRYLADVDDVAYIRFASVYREFEDGEDFLRIISGLRNKKDTPKPTGRKSSSMAAKDSSAAGKNIATSKKKSETKKPKSPRKPKPGSPTPKS